MRNRLYQRFKNGLVQFSNNAQKNTRVGTNYVSVKFPNSLKAVRLKGPMFDSRTDYATLRTQMSDSHGAVVLAVPQYEQATKRLSALLSERANSLAGNIKIIQPTKITNEKKNGAKAKRFRPDDGKCAKPDGGHELSVPARGVERELFQISSGKRSHADDRGRAQSDE